MIVGAQIENDFITISLPVTVMLIYVEPIMIGSIISTEYIL